MDRREFLGGAGVLALFGGAGCLCGYSASAAGDGAGNGTDGTTSAAPTTRPPTTAPTTGSTPTPTAGPGTTTGEGTEEPGTTTPTTATTTTPTPTTTAGPPSSVTVEVGGESTRFFPGEFVLAQGGTVEWVWRGNNHNVVPTGQPGGADWPGSGGGSERLFDEPHTYTHTFGTTGSYEYECTQHAQFGMVGSFEVR